MCYLCMCNFECGGALIRITCHLGRLGSLNLSSEQMEELDPLGDLSPDDSISPLERLDNYFQSEELGDRYMCTLHVNY